MTTVPAQPPASPRQIAPAPHLHAGHGAGTRRMMLDVLLALAPSVAVSVWVFHWYALVQLGVCVLSCLGAEILFEAMRGRRAPFEDGSAAVTGVILGLSLPWSAPWHIGCIGSFVAMGFGKAAFGGLGFNLFNPAMVGRAFVMLSFARELAATAYVSSDSGAGIVTQATPLSAIKALGERAGTTEFWPMFLGDVNGWLGAGSAVALLAGGIYLCARRTASWEIPAGTILAVLVTAGLLNFSGVTPITSLQHLLSGALLFGAFFIATDPVTSPVAPLGKLVFGAGVGTTVIVLRVFSSYPEGVMFSILLMNGLTPLINRLTIPQPLGGPATPRAGERGTR